MRWLRISRLPVMSTKTQVQQSHAASGWRHNPQTGEYQLGPS